MAEASGMAVLGALRFVKARSDSDGLDRVVETAGHSVRAALAQRVRTLSWYPYEVYVALLTAIDRELGTGDLSLCRELGELAGRTDLKSVFSFYQQADDPEKLIRACSTVWPMYYRDAGSMEAVAWSPEQTILRITDFPDMHPAHCRLMEGWMISAMLTIGVRVSDDASETECTSRGGSCHEFQCTWSRARPPRSDRAKSSRPEDKRAKSNRPDGGDGP